MLKQTKIDDLRAMLRTHAARLHLPNTAGAGPSPSHLPAMAFRLLAVVALMLLTLSPATGAQAHGSQPQDLIKGVRFEQKLNAQLPLALSFRDETGQTVALSSYFGQKPVILVFAYYDCPMLCTLVLNSLLDTLKQLKFDVGQEFEVITVSIAPAETPELAQAKKGTYLQQYGRAGAEAGWHFLTGDEPAIHQLTEAAGFFYQYDAERNEYAHPTGIMILTPQGKIARYIYGIKFPATDVRLGLVEAAEGKIGSPVDQLLLTCYHYDPVTGKYTVAIMDVIRLAGLATTGAIGVVVGGYLWRERRKKE